MADLTDKQIAIGNGAPALEPTIYVACHQCENCGHIGINDEASPDDGTCRHCDWRGPYPQDDTCPGCGRDSCIEAVCPQCEGCYVLLVEDHIPAGVAPSQAPNTDPENQYIGDLMILQVLADSDSVNDQEREVLLRWIEHSQPPGVKEDGKC